MLTSSKTILEAAKAGHFAVPSANFVDAASLKSHVMTAEAMNLPLIIGLAESHFGRFFSIEEGAYFGKFYAEQVKTPIVLHLDHGESVEMTKKAVDLGFTSVMLDASMESIDVNIEMTKRVIDYARPRGVTVEAEIGHVGTGAKYDNDSDNIYTTVEEAARFVELTDVDTLAVSIGTAHGLYKGTPKINFDRLHELAAEVKAPLVLHGGSSSGDRNLNRCATEGIAKINIYSDFMVSGANAVYALPGQEAVVEDYYTIQEAARSSRRSSEPCSAPSSQWAPSLRSTRCPPCSRSTDRSALTSSPSD